MTALDRTGDWKDDEDRPKPIPPKTRLVRDGGGGGACLYIPVVILLLYLAGAFG